MPSDKVANSFSSSRGVQHYVPRGKCAYEDEPPTKIDAPKLNLYSLDYRIIIVQYGVTQ